RAGIQRNFKPQHPKRAAYYCLEFLWSLNVGVWCFVPLVGWENTRCVAQRATATWAIQTSRRFHAGRCVPVFCAAQLQNAQSVPETVRSSTGKFDDAPA